MNLYFLVVMAVKRHSYGGVQPSYVTATGVFANENEALGQCVKLGYEYMPTPDWCDHLPRVVVAESGHWPGGYKVTVDVQEM